MLSEFLDDLAVRDAIEEHLIQLITDRFWQPGDVTVSTVMRGFHRGGKVQNGTVLGFGF